MDGCHIEWLAGRVVTRENRVVAGAVEGKPLVEGKLLAVEGELLAVEGKFLAVDVQILTVDVKLLAVNVKTYECVPIKEHGVDGKNRQVDLHVRFQL